MGNAREDITASIHEILDKMDEEQLLRAYAEACEIISDQEAQVR